MSIVPRRHFIWGRCFRLVRRLDFVCRHAHIHMHCTDISIAIRVGLLLNKAWMIVSFLCFQKALKAQGIARETLPCQHFQTQLKLYLTLLTLRCSVQAPRWAMYKFWAPKVTLFMFITIGLTFRFQVFTNGRVSVIVKQEGQQARLNYIAVGYQNIHHGLLYGKRTEPHRAMAFDLTRFNRSGFSHWPSTCSPNSSSSSHRQILQRASIFSPEKPKSMPSKAFSIDFAAIH